MDQVLRWLVAADDFVVRAPRCVAKKDLRNVLHLDYFAKYQSFAEVQISDTLIKLVAQTVFDHVEVFSPKTNKDPGQLFDRNDQWQGRQG